MSLPPTSQLHMAIEKKKQIKKETFKKILEQFSKKIKYANDAGSTHVLLSTPSFVMGFPSFDVSSATAYLIRQLKNGGYKTQLMSPNVIYVDWKKEKPSPELPKRTSKPATRTERDVIQDEFSSFINLKKVADKYK